eukprot:Skav207663  [mRNA]  locus=scaffold1857:34418:46615:- [translate_table: standard]
MAASSSWEAHELHPWRCRCGHLNRKKDFYCGKCSASWELGTPEPPKPKTQPWTYKWDDWGDADWDHGQWVYTPRGGGHRAPSQSRDKPTKPSKKEKTKDKGKAKGSKGKGKGKNMGKEAGPKGKEAPPTWRSPLAAPLPAPPPVPNPPSPMEQEMGRMMSVLRKNAESLPAEVQSLLQESTIKETKVGVKEMHAAVAEYGRTRFSLNEAMSARATLHSAWKSFIVNSIQQWEKYVQEFHRSGQEHIGCGQVEAWEDQEGSQDRGRRYRGERRRRRATSGLLGYDLGEPPTCAGDFEVTQAQGGRIGGGPQQAYQDHGTTGRTRRRSSCTGRNPSWGFAIMCAFWRGGQSVTSAYLCQAPQDAFTEPNFPRHSPESTLVDTWECAWDAHCRVFNDRLNSWRQSHAAKFRSAFDTGIGEAADRGGKLLRFHDVVQVRFCCEDFAPTLTTSVPEAFFHNAEDKPWALYENRPHCLDTEHSCVEHNWQDAAFPVLMPGVTDEAAHVDGRLELHDDAPQFLTELNSVVLPAASMYPPVLTLDDDSCKDATDVRKCRGLLHRDDVFAVARVEQFCATQVNACLVYHNGQAWSLQNEEPHPILHGDVLRVLTPPLEVSRTGDSCQDILQFDPPAVSPSTEGRLDNISDVVSSVASEEPTHDADVPALTRGSNRISVCVWAVVHGRYPRCEQPRNAFISLEAHGWQDEITDLWQGVLHPNAPTGFHVVTPPPQIQQPVVSQPCLHIVAEQGLSQARRAVLVSVAAREPLYAGPPTLAVSVPAYVSGAIVARAVALPPRLRDSPQMVVRTQRGVLPFADITPCSGGAHFLLDFRDDSEDIALMQHSLESHRTQDVNSSEGSGGHDSLTCSDCYSFLSWYIDHNAHRICTHPRRLRLCSQLRDWLDQISAVWNEEFDRTRAFRISIVFPQPFQLDTEPALLQVIIEQAFHLPRSAILLEQELDRGDQPSCQAYSISQTSSVSALTDLAAPSVRRDLHSQVILVYMHRVFSAQEFWLPTGAYAALLWRTPPAVEEIALFQKPLAHPAKASSPLPVLQSETRGDYTLQHQQGGRVRSDVAADLCLGLPQRHGLDLDDGTAFREDEAWQPPVESSYVPSRPAGIASPRYEPGSMRALLEWWVVGEARDLFEQQEGPTFLTFYVNGHDRPRCDDARLFRPGRLLDPEHWADLLRRIWRDFILPGEPMHYFVVDPQPPADNEAAPVIHLLLFQRWVPRFTPIHFSSRFREEGWRYHAILAAEQLNEFAATILSDQAPYCFRPMLNYDCRLFFKNQPWPPGRVFRPAAADGLRIDVQPAAGSQALEHIEEQAHAILPGHDFDRVMTDVHRTMSMTYHSAYIPVHAWFIDHRNFLTCDQSRVLVLTRERDWHLQACALWWDRCRPTQPLRVALVNPQPLHLWTEPSTLHVILYQDSGVVNRCAVMTTSVVSWTIRTRVLSVPVDATPDHLCGLLGLSHLISGDSPSHFLACEWQHRDISLHEDIRAQPGAGLTLNFEPAVEPPGWHTSRRSRATDDLSSMVQLPLHRESAPAFDVAAEAEATWAEFEQDLSSRCWELLDVQVWFVSHVHHPHCPRSRIVHLARRVNTWQQQMQDIWRDVISPGDPVFITLAQPVFRCPMRPEPHILLWQHPIPGRVVGLAIACAEPYVPSAVQIDAVSVPDALSVREIFTQSRWDPSAFEPRALWYLHGDWLAHEFIALMDGACWTTLLKSVPQRDSGDTAPTLLQLSATISSRHDRPSDAGLTGDPDESASVRPSLQQVGSLQVCPQEKVGSRTVLLLDDLIEEPPVMPLEGPYRRFPIAGLDELSTRLLDFRFDLQVALPAPDSIDHEIAARLWSCQQQAAAAQGPVVHIEIYTDGSCIQQDPSKHPAWAIVIVHHFASGHCEFQGFAASCLSDSCIVQQCAPTGHRCNAFDAECMALLFALLKAINCDFFVHGVPLTIVSDAWAALQCADGHWTAHHNAFLAEFVRPLWHATAQLGCLQGRWQRAHTGDLFNEIANHVAQHCAYTQPPCRLQPPIEVSDRSPLQWLWLLWRSQLESFGPHFEDDMLMIHAPPPCGTADTERWPHHAPQHQCTAVIEFECITYNVGTLKGWANRAPGKAWTSRQELLLQQLSNQHCVCLQETRRHHDHPWKERGWCGFCGPAQKGQGGTEIWLNTRDPFAWLHSDGRDPVPVYFSQQGCQIVFADAQTLLLHFHTQEFELLIVSAHAPHEAADDEAKLHFWTQLTTHCRKFPGVPLLGGIDANARLGSCPSSSVGSFCSEPQNRNGELFHEFLVTTNTCVPTTFPSTEWQQWLQSGTWRSLSGWHRLDYPIWPMQWVSASLQAHNDSINLEHRHDDHISSAIRGHVEVVVHAAPALVRPQIDKTQMRTPEGQQMCAALLQRFTLQSEVALWNASADRAAAMVDNWFQSALSQAFPVVSTRAQPQWLSQDTLWLRQESRRARRQMTRIDAHVKNHLTRAVFLAWRRRSGRGFPFGAACTTDLGMQDGIARSIHYLQRVLARLFRWWSHFALHFHADGAGTSSYAPWLRQCHMAWAHNASIVRSRRHQLAVALQADEAAFVQDLTEQSGSHMAEARPADFWKRLRPLLPKQRQKADLHKAKFMATDRSFTDHFAEVEQAEVVPLPVLADSVALGNRRPSDAVVIDRPPITPEDPSQGAFQCEHCDKHFESAKALSVHCKTQHNIYAVARHFMPHPTVCQSCLKMFGNSQKLRQHLQHGRTGCLQHLQSILSPLTTAEVDQVPTVSMRQTRNEFRQPAVQLAGPHLPSRDDWQRAAPHRPEPARLVRHPVISDVSCDLTDWFLNVQLGEPPVDPGHVTVSVLESFSDYIEMFQDEPTYTAAVRLARVWIDLQASRLRSSLTSASPGEVLPRPVTPSPALHFKVLCCGLDDDTVGALRAFSRNFALSTGTEIVFEDALAFSETTPYDLTLTHQLQRWKSVSSDGTFLGTICHPGQGCRHFGPTGAATGRLSHEQCLADIDGFGAWYTAVTHGLPLRAHWIALVSKPAHRDGDRSDDWPDSFLDTVDGTVLSCEVHTGTFFGSHRSTRLRIFSQGLPALDESLHRWKLPSVPVGDWPQRPGYLGAIVDAFYQQAFLQQATRPVAL